MQRAADNDRLLAYYVKVISVRQDCVGPNATASRAGKVTETLCEISGPGNSVNIGNSGHRIYPWRVQNSTIELYLAWGKDGTLRDYDYGILQSKNLNLNFLCFHF